MNTTTKSTTTKRPATFTKSEWENTTFRVYTGLVRLVKGEITLAQFVNHPTVKELCDKCGITAGMSDKDAAKTRGTMTVSLIISMAKDRTHDHEKERHIAPIYRLRDFFNGGYKAKAELPVTYTEPKEPKAPSAKKAAPKKVKNVSIEQWVNGLTPEQIDNLKVALAAKDMDLEAVA